MFSLIITIVSIALVVALVAATMYHGGDTLTQGRTSAQASELVTSAQQIAGAYRMDQALNAKNPISMAELVADGVLKSVPSQFAENEWSASLMTKQKFGTSFDYIRSSREDITIEVCNALDKMAGRAPTAREDLPGNTEEDKFHAYGCYAGEGLAFYFKM